MSARCRRQENGAERCRNRRADRLPCSPSLSADEVLTEIADAVIAGEPVDETPFQHLNRAQRRAAKKQFVPGCPGCEAGAPRW